MKSFELVILVHYLRNLLDEFNIYSSKISNLFIFTLLFFRLKLLQKLWLVTIRSDIILREINIFVITSSRQLEDLASVSDNYYTKLKKKKKKKWKSLAKEQLRTFEKFWEKQ